MDFEIKFYHKYHKYLNILFIFLNLFKSITLSKARASSLILNVVVYKVLKYIGISYTIYDNSTSCILYYVAPIKPKPFSTWKC